MSDAPDLKPLVVYDGDCGFCRSWIERWRARTRDAVEYRPYQEVAREFPEIPQDRFQRAVQLREPDGTWSSGARAVFRALAYAPGGAWAWRAYEGIPLVQPASELAYRFVASHRPALARITSWIWGRHLVPPGETLTSWIFLRALGLIFLAAFLSAWVQISGLVGSHGILPAHFYLQALGTRYGSLAYWIAPTLGWISTSDWFLQALCAAGALLSVLLTFGAAPIACLAGLWALYLSVSILGQEFFWFQWDSLLVETAFLAIFLAPWKWWSWPRSDPRPARLSLWLLRWLVFRLSVSSAAVKLSSGDPTWRNGTALQYHFETQPLPTWIGWYAHHLPASLLRAATVGTLVLEGIAPLLIFGPRRIRFLGAASIAGLQILIFLTGNYCFFNLLAIALVIPLLDDGVWPGRLRQWALTGERVGAARGRWWGWLLKPVAVLLIGTSLVPFVRAFGKSTTWLGPLELFHQAAWPFRSINNYGLFAVMTTQRNEIVLEGSRDGEHWLAYEFRYKPGDLTRRPGFVEPHQPRVDWQMWFAALSDFRQQPWFLSFCQRILQGDAPVLALLERNPFPLSPPRYLRAVVYDYHFTDTKTRAETSAWWRRSALGLYCPVLTLSGGQLAAVMPDSSRATPSYVSP
jgi:predicted DCC family thiol-disulfide oxidoreductase YuxK